MSFQQGLSGLKGASSSLDVISNNIANSSTVGFKSSTAHFADIFASSLQGGSGTIGLGVTLSAVQQDFSSGDIETTGNTLDLAIEGTGFYCVSANGTLAYTRNGQFHLDANGYIVNDQGAVLTGTMADSSGNIADTISTDLMQITYDNSGGQPQATSTVDLSVNLNSNDDVPTTSTFDITDSTSYNWTTSITVYDSLGNSHSMEFYYVKSSTANQWDMYTTLDGDATTQTGPETLTFTSNGLLDTTTTTMPLSYSYAVSTGASNIDVSLDLTGTTQWGSDFSVSDQNQDGFTSGELTGIAIATDGTVSATYDNGETKDIGRINLWTFKNQNGLTSLGDNLWGETSESGTPVGGKADSGQFGSIASGSVEASNVDLTAELVDMIVQQRAYQANAKSITTQSEILQTLVNI
jgi:flagellar hook protein FlgE